MHDPSADPVQINNLIVARYRDGRVLKGTTRDFLPNRPMFHVERPGGEIVELHTRDLKAVFFVKSLDGDPSREDVRGFVAGPAETSQGRKLAVRFCDDEFLCGYALSWTPNREGFFLFPADVAHNNQRIWIQSAATKEIKAGPQAEQLAERVLAEQKAAGTRGTRVDGTGSPQTPKIPGPGTPPRPMDSATDIVPRPFGLNSDPKRRDGNAA